MPLEGSDRALVEQTAAHAAAARGAAETVAVTLGNVLAIVTALVAAVQRLAPACYVLNGDDPRGAVWIVTGAGAAKTWVVDGAQMGALLRRFPMAIEVWAGAELARVPTFGPEPPPEVDPSAAEVLAAAGAS